jgi:hypothetical protein
VCSLHILAAAAVSLRQVGLTASEGVRIVLKMAVQNWSTRPISFVCLLALSKVALAASATQLVLSNDFCLIEPCGPHPPPARVATSGVSFEIFVAALDAERAADISYSGTINFLSTDPLATLPLSCTFLPEDRGDRAFTAILRTQGDQTITVIDSLHALTPGTLVMTVTGLGVTEPIPTSSALMKTLLVVGLAAAAIWVSRMRS